MTNSKGFNERMRSRRIELGFSLTDLANKLNMSVSQASRYESGDRTPRADIASRIALALNVNLEWLLTGKGSHLVQEAPPSLSRASSTQDPSSQLSITLSSDATNKLREVAKYEGIDEYLLSMNLIYEAINHKYELINVSDICTSGLMKLLNSFEDEYSSSLLRIANLVSEIENPYTKYYFGQIEDSQSSVYRLLGSLKRKIDYIEEKSNEIKESIADMEEWYLNESSKEEVAQQAIKYANDASNIIPKDICENIFASIFDSDALRNSLKILENWVKSTQGIDQKEFITACFKLKHAAILSFAPASNIDMINFLANSSRFYAIFKEQEENTSNQK